MKPDLSDAVSAAQLLLGWKLVHESAEGTTSGIIVETEAYTAQDAASHSFRGMTERNKIMFGPSGYLYVYFTYGMHYCINIVTGNKSDGQAVLIRALEPLDGVPLMQQRRKRSDQLTSGPAKLAQAMGLSLAHNGMYVLGQASVRIEKGSLRDFSVVQSPRIGIRKDVDRPWRFYLTNNPHVSKP